MRSCGYKQAVVEVERQVIAWFEVDDPDLFKDNFPISIITGKLPSRELLLKLKPHVSCSWLIETCAKFLVYASLTSHHVRQLQPGTYVCLWLHMEPNQSS